MQTVPDPEIGQAANRNARFTAVYTRGRILVEAVGEAAVNVIDVGAYTGETASWFADMFPDATIWAIEPFPESFAALSAMSNERVRAFQFAASDFDGQTELFTNAIAHTNSLYSLNPESTDSLDISRRRETGELAEAVLAAGRMQVQARRLDTFVGEVGIEVIDLLKVDVQGAEIDVLTGAQGILERVRTVMIEISLYDYYTASGSIGQVEEILSPYGFSLWSITDISNNPMNGRTDWVELLYVKK